MSKQIETVEGLNIQLHGVDVAVIAHYAGGKNILTFSPEFVAMPTDKRPVFTLRQLLDPSYLSRPQIRTDKIPPVLSNLLPEGALRELTAQALRCHINNEFSILAYLGANLPGAIIAQPIKAGGLPDWALEQLCSYPYKLDLDLGKKNLRGREAYAAVTEVSHIRDHYLPLLTDNWFKTMLATCAIPGLYSGSVKLSGERFVDGGVTAAVPVQEAWRQGSRNIIVIRTEYLEQNSEEEEAQQDQPKPHWIREPISLIQEKWSGKVEKWKVDWDGFWQDQIDKSKNKKREHKHLELLNGGRWLFGAGDVYRLSHLLGGKFDSGLADFLMVHYQTFALTQTFLDQPPEDCFILQIAPAKPLKSSPLLSKEEDLKHDYQLGLDAGYAFIKQYNITKHNFRA